MPTPFDAVPAKSNSVWRVGDTFFGTYVALGYSVPTSDSKRDYFDFMSDVDFLTGAGGASCAPDNNGEPLSGKYTCAAAAADETNQHFHKAYFEVKPMPASSEPAYTAASRR